MYNSANKRVPFRLASSVKSWGFLFVVLDFLGSRVGKVSRTSSSADMVAEQDNLVVGRDDLIADDGEGDRSTIEAKDDAALLVSYYNLDAIPCFPGHSLLTACCSERWATSRSV